MTADAVSNPLTTLLNNAKKLSRRELILVSATLSVAIFGLAYITWFAPMEKKQATLNAELIEKQRILNEVTATLKTPTHNPEDPNTTKRAQFDHWLDRLRAADASLTKNTQRLTQATDAMRVVERALANYPHIHLEKFTNLPPTLIMKNEDTLSKDLSQTLRALLPDSEFILYRHVMVAEVRGPYRELIAYLHRLEKTSQQLFIGEVNLTTKDYPDAVLSVELVTLSPHRALYRAQAQSMN